MNNFNLKLVAAFAAATLLSITVMAQQPESKDAKPKRGVVAKTVAKAKEVIVDAPPPQPIPQITYPQAQPSQHQTGSLFSEGAAKANLFDDFKARNVGDVVTISVVETTTASVNSDASRTRKSGTLINTPAILDAVAPNAGAGEIVKGLGDREFKGTGATSRTSTVRLALSARVVQVLPNGDLVIEGSKVRAINKETEMVVLRGIVRPRDVTANNIVLSTAIADMQIRLNGKGVASADNQPGWLYRFLSRVSPF